MPFDLTTWLLVFLRVGALLAVFPIFSMSNVPVQLRVALGALLALLIAAAVPALAAPPASFGALVFLMCKEVVVGLVLGFVSRMIFYTLELAGNVIATELGLNAGSMLNPFSNSRSEAPGLILFYLGALIFLTLNMHHWLLVAIQRSYLFLPIGGARMHPALFQDLLGRTSQLFVVGLLMAAPVVAVSFLVNLVFSVIGRAVPQMNVFVESFSFRALAGLAVFGLTLNLIAQHAVNYLRRLPEDLLRVTQLLGAP
jgi:flagellar biosynthetic protein FliR